MIAARNDGLSVIRRKLLRGALSKSFFAEAAASLYWRMHADSQRHLSLANSEASNNASFENPFSLSGGKSALHPFLPTQKVVKILALPVGVSVWSYFLKCANPISGRREHEL